jgi:large conductance mechanosensitive channel
MKPIIEELEKPIHKVSPILHEFKAFAVRGNVIDLAVGVIIGAAFGKVVDSLVKDVLMPPLSLLIGEIDLSNRYLNLSGKIFANLAEAKAASAPVITYGNFLNTIISFVIVAFCIFMMVRTINKLYPKPVPVEPVKPATKECPFCFSAIAEKAKRCPHCTSQLG